MEDNRPFWQRFGQFLQPGAEAFGSSMVPAWMQPQPQPTPYQGGTMAGGAGRTFEGDPIQSAQQAATANNLTQLQPQPFMGPTQEQNTDLYGELFSQLPIQEQVRLRTKRQDRAAEPPDMSSGAVKARLGYQGPDFVGGPDASARRASSNLRISNRTAPISASRQGKGTVSNMIANDIVPTRPDAQRDYYRQKAEIEQAKAEAAIQKQNSDFITDTDPIERAAARAQAESLGKQPDWRVQIAQFAVPILQQRLQAALQSGNPQAVQAAEDSLLQFLQGIGSNQGYFPGSFPEPTS